MSESVYIADFGRFIKVGRSRDPEFRIKCLSSMFGIAPISTYSREFNDACKIETMVIGALSHSSFPVHPIKRETFKFPFGAASESLRNICEDYVEKTISTRESELIRRLNRGERNKIKTDYKNILNKLFKELEK